jgi:hypothetical protein
VAPCGKHVDRIDGDAEGNFLARLRLDSGLCGECDLRLSLGLDPGGRHAHDRGLLASHQWALVSLENHALISREFDRALPEKAENDRSRNERNDHRGCEQRAISAWSAPGFGNEALKPLRLNNGPAGCSIGTSRRIRSETLGHRLGRRLPFGL